MVTTSLEYVLICLCCSSSQGIPDLDVAVGQVSASDQYFNKHVTYCSLALNVHFRHNDLHIKALLDIRSFFLFLVNNYFVALAVSHTLFYIFS